MNRIPSLVSVSVVDPFALLAASLSTTGAVPARFYLILYFFSVADLIVQLQLITLLLKFIAHVRRCKLHTL